MESECKKSRVSPLVKQCFVTASVAFNIVGHGAAIGYPAVLAPQLPPPPSALLPHEDAASWVASILGITQLLGGLLAPALMARAGRRPAHLITAIPALAGWLTLAAATSYTELLVGRALCGLSVGLLAPLRSALIGEYVSPVRRGALLTTVALAQAAGIFLVHLVGSRLLSWERTALLFAMFHFTSLLMTLYAPESPIWLAQRGRLEECRAVYRWLRGPAEEAELAAMIAAREREREERACERAVSLRETVVRPEFYKPIALMTHAYITSNFAGATVMAGYAPQVLRELLGPTADAALWMVLLDGQRLLLNSVAVYFIGRFRRRPMMLWTGALAVLSQSALALVAWGRAGGWAGGGLWLPAALINLQFASIATGVLPLPNVLGGEVFPLRYRGAGGGVSLTALSLTFFLVQKTWPGLVARAGLGGAYALHSAALLYCYAVVLALLPETRGRTLQQIEDEFRGVRPALDVEGEALAAPENDEKEKLNGKP